MSKLNRLDGVESTLSEFSRPLVGVASGETTLPILWQSIFLFLGVSLNGCSYGISLPILLYALEKVSDVGSSNIES